MAEQTKRLFGTNGIRGIPNKELTSDFCLSIGKAIGTYFGGTVALGSDNRLTKDMLLEAVNAGILSTGTNVVKIGVMPTPGIQYYCKTHSIPGVMITASHNPPQFNGIKCIDSDGTELARSKEEKIEEIYFDSAFKISNWDVMGTNKDDNTGPDNYLNGVMSKIDVNRIRERKFRICADLGNGAAYLTTPELLSRLKCSVVTLNANPDGLFTSRESEPKPANLKYLMSLVSSGEFDFGVAHDGDADRTVFIDEKGNFIDGDKTLSLFVKHFVKKGDMVVTPVSSSDAIEDICKESGSSVVRTRVGAPIVSRSMIEKKATLGGEENGGIIYGPHQYCRDGAMTLGIILDIMSRTGKKLSELISEIPQYTIVRKTIPSTGKFEEFSKKLEEHLKGYSVDRMDGIKVRKDHNWVLARPSGTEPIIRIFTHSDKREEAERLMNEVTELLK